MALKDAVMALVALAVPIWLLVEQVVRWLHFPDSPVEQPTKKGSVETLEPPTFSPLPRKVAQSGNLRRNSTMALEVALTWVVALAVPVWLVAEELLVRRRSAEERSVKLASAIREKSVLSPVDLLSEPSREAA